jgi:hypothetical protein
MANDENGRREQQRRNEERRRQDDRRGGSKRRPVAKEKRPRSAIGTIGAAGSRCGCKDDEYRGA